MEVEVACRKNSRRLPKSQSKFKGHSKRRFKQDQRRENFQQERTPQPTQRGNKPREGDFTQRKQLTDKESDTKELQRWITSSGSQFRTQPGSHHNDQEHEGSRHTGEDDSSVCTSEINSGDEVGSKRHESRHGTSLIRQRGKWE